MTHTSTPNHQYCMLPYRCRSLSLVSSLPTKNVRSGVLGKFFLPSINIWYVNPEKHPNVSPQQKSFCRIPSKHMTLKSMYCLYKLCIRKHCTSIYNFCSEMLCSNKIYIFLYHPSISQVIVVVKDYQILTSRLVIVQKRMVMPILSVSQTWAFPRVLQRHSRAVLSSLVDICISKRIYHTPTTWRTF